MTDAGLKRFVAHSIKKRNLVRFAQRMQSFQLHFTDIDSVLAPLGMRATVSVQNYDPKWIEKVLGKIQGLLEHVEFNAQNLRNAAAVVLIDEPERVVACSVLFFLPAPDNAMQIIWEGVDPSFRELRPTLFLAAERSSVMVAHRDLCIAMNLLHSDDIGVRVAVSKADKQKSRERRRFLEGLGFKDLMLESAKEFTYEKLLPLTYAYETAFTTVEGAMTNRELAEALVHPCLGRALSESFNEEPRLGRTLSESFNEEPRLGRALSEVCTLGRTPSEAGNEEPCLGRTLSESLNEEEPTLRSHMSPPKCDTPVLFVTPPSIPMEAPFIKPLVRRALDWEELRRNNTNGADFPVMMPKQ